MGYYITWSSPFSRFSLILAMAKTTHVPNFSFFANLYSNDVVNSADNFSCMYFGSSMLVVGHTCTGASVTHVIRPSTSSTSEIPHELGCFYVFSRPANLYAANERTPHQMGWMRKKQDATIKRDCLGILMKMSFWCFPKWLSHPTHPYN